MNLNPADRADFAVLHMFNDAGLADWNRNKSEIGHYEGTESGVNTLIKFEWETVRGLRTAAKGATGRETDWEVWNV